MMALDGFSLAIGAGGGALLAGMVASIWIFRLAQARAGLQARLDAAQSAREEIGGLFALTAREALEKNSEQFLTLAREKLKQEQAEGAHDLEKRQTAIAAMVKPVGDTLVQLNQAVEQLKGTDKTIRDDLSLLTRETAKLAGALRNTAAQGKWGEYILEKLLDNCGLIKGQHYDTQVPMKSDTLGDQRPDAVIHLQDGFNIVVDAKAPLNEFIQVLEREDIGEDEYRAVCARMAATVRNHVKKLGAKAYWENLESPDFVVLFLPSEHLFSAALRADPALIDFASENKIVIASPTLMMSLLRVVHLGWRQMEMALNARQISDAAAELYARTVKFQDYIEKIGKSLYGAVESYNSAISSLEKRVFPAARRMRKLGVQGGGRDLKEIAEIELHPRALTAPDDFLEDGEDETTVPEGKTAHG